jgi:hypothetical protein
MNHKLIGKVAGNRNELPSGKMELTNHRQEPYREHQSISTPQMVETDTIDTIFLCKQIVQITEKTHSSCGQKLAHRGIALKIQYRHEQNLQIQIRKQLIRNTSHLLPRQA